MKLAGFTPTDARARRLMRRYSNDVIHIDDVSTVCVFKPDVIELDRRGSACVPVLYISGVVDKFVPDQSAERFMPFDINEITTDKDNPQRVDLHYFFTTEQLKKMVDNGLFTDEFAPNRDLLRKNQLEVCVMASYEILPPVTMDTPPVVTTRVANLHGIEVDQKTIGYDFSADEVMPSVMAEVADKEHATQRGYAPQTDKNHEDMFAAEALPESNRYESDYEFTAADAHTPAEDALTVTERYIRDTDVELRGPKALDAVDSAVSRQWRDFEQRQQVDAGTGSLDPDRRKVDEIFRDKIALSTPAAPADMGIDSLDLDDVDFENMVIEDDQLADTGVDAEQPEAEEVEPEVEVDDSTSRDLFADEDDPSVTKAKEAERARRARTIAVDDEQPGGEQPRDERSSDETAGKESKATKDSDAVRAKESQRRAINRRIQRTQRVVQEQQNQAAEAEKNAADDEFGL